MAQLIDEYLGSIKDRNIEMALREIIKIVLSSSGGATDADIAAIAALPGTPGLLRKLGVNSWEIDTTDYSGGGALDADLVAIAALAGTSGFLTKTGANTWALDTTVYATSSALAAKADTTTVNSSLALKADASALTSGLALKADSSAMTTALGLKADASALSSGLALKANQATTYTKTEDDTLLALKADAVDLTALSDSVDAQLLVFQDQVRAIPITHAELTTLRNNIIATPSTAPEIGQRYALTDAGLLQNKTVEWDGDSFVFKGTISLNANTTTGLVQRTSDNTTDTTFANLVEITIPGFLMGKNTNIHSRVRALGDTNNAAVKQFRIQMQQAANTVTTSNKTIGATHIDGEHYWDVWNRNVYNQQHHHNTLSLGSDTTANALLTGAMDTVNDFFWRVQSSWSAQQPTTSVITLMGYSLEFK